MPSITIQDSQLAALKGKVVVLTGGSSGIGLATVGKLLAQGAKVVSGDLSPPKATPDASSFTFQVCDVTSWASLVSLFKLAVATHGRIDHVFANAGISNYQHESYVGDLPLDPATGEPLEPSFPVLAVNLFGAMNTVRLAIHHFKSQSAAASADASSSSIVITASAAAFMPFGLSEYGTSKHGILGFARSLREQLARAGHDKTIRVNSVAPAFTDTNIMNADQVRAWGMVVQGAEVVARSVAWLMAEQSCDQRVVYSHGGKYRDIETELLAGARQALGEDWSAPTRRTVPGNGALDITDSVAGSASTNGAGKA